MATNNAVNTSLSGQSGTGSFAGNASPVFTTPTLGVASATSISFSSTTEIVGTTTNNNAAAGSVGEVISSVVSGVAITDNTVTNVTSISLTAGDWDVVGNIITTPSSTQTAIACGINTVSATLPTQFNILALTNTFSAGIATGIDAPTVRLSLAGTTTVYLVAISSYSGSLTISGTILARRRR